MRGFRLLLLVAALAVICAGASQAVVYVDQSSPGPAHDGLSWDTAFLTIQAAIDANPPGAEIWVANGTYVENVVLNIANSVYGGFLGAEPGGYETTLDQRSINANVVTIDGNQAGSCVIVSEGSRLEGVTVTNGNAVMGGGVYSPFTSAWVNYVTMNANTAMFGGGFYGDQASPQVTNCTIVYNTATVAGGGVYCNNTSGPIAQNIIANNNSLGTGGAVYCNAGAPSVVSSTITNNLSLSSGGAIFTDSGSAAFVAGNTIAGNHANGDGGGIVCTNGSLMQAMGNNLPGNSAGGNGGGIYCANNSAPVLTGNALMGSHADGNGGGMYCDNSSPVLLGITFVGSSATGNGGAIYAVNGSKPDLTACNVIGSQAVRGAGIYCHASWLSATTCTISNNTATTDGGGIYSDGSKLLISECMMDANSAYIGFLGGAIACVNSEPTIAGNMITSCLAGYGAGIGLLGCSKAVVRSNVLRGNTADVDGGGIWYSTSLVRLIGNTMAGNVALNGGGGGACSVNSVSGIHNNILSQNTAAGTVGGGVLCDPLSTTTLTHNDAWVNIPDDYNGCAPGPGSLFLDPLFVAADNLHLQPGSLCIDQGTNKAPEMGYKDIDGDPRVCDGNGDGIAIVDMGADEFRTTAELTTVPPNLFLPGWVWFSIPLDPINPDASAVLGFNAENVVYGWDNLVKTFLLCPGDFTDLAVGPSYLAFKTTNANPSYLGTQPALPYEYTLPAAGFSWVGVPATQDIGGLDLKVKKNGVTRTASEDYAAVDPWINWGWIYWDSAIRTARIMSPFIGGDDNTLHPWFGYRVWANTADVTIIFP